MKGLEALKVIYSLEDLQGGRDAFWKSFRIIEKELKDKEQLEMMYSNCVIEGTKQKKALEIIKKTKPNIKDLKIDKPTYEEILNDYNFNKSSYWFIELPNKEEYDLLKEVLL